MPGVHCHPGASCTVAVLLCTLQDCIPTVSQYLYFRPRMSGSKCKSSSDAAGACSVAQLCQLLSRVRLFTTPWTVACQTPLSMGFYREEYCSRLPLPPPGDLSNPGIELFSWDVAQTTAVCVCVCVVCILLCMYARSCPAFCDPMGCSQPGSSVHGISQKRTLEWVGVSSSKGSSWPRDQTHVSCDRQILCYCVTWEAQEVIL